MAIPPSECLRPSKRPPFANLEPEEPPGADESSYLVALIFATFAYPDARATAAAAAPKIVPTYGTAAKDSKAATADAIVLTIAAATCSFLPLSNAFLLISSAFLALSLSSDIFF